MTQTTLSLAKTTQPTLSMVLNRERLFDKLDSNNDKRAVWITGPPGAGKTTLSASYIKETGKKTLWYHLDSSDTDIATFFFYLRQSAIKHSKNADHIIPQLPVGVSDWVAFGCRLFRAIFSRFNEPLIIVFDNYEVIPPHSELHRIFANIIDEVPAHSRLFFTGRIEPGSPFARVRANGDLLLIDGDDLKLTSNENIQLAKIRDVKSSKEALKTIHQASAGWITGVILMMEYTRQSRQTGQVAYAESGSILYDYVAEEIFTGFDKSTKEFLLKVCWCRRLSIALAEKISEDKNARLMLVNLSRYGSGRR